IFLSSGSPHNLLTLSFHEGFYRLYGEQNIVPYENDKSVSISMDERTSSGFSSQKPYMYGSFSASIKLPEDYTAGVVVAFYVANNQNHPYNHDEIDIEFLGHIDGENWLYSILWNEKQIIYYVDDVPIREVRRTEAMEGDWPSKPMTLYGTIWNGSDWATHGGKYKIDLKYSPFVAKYSDFVLNGCPVNPIQIQPPKCEAPIRAGVTPDQRRKMKNFRRKHMTYSYCYDKNR
ncbi:unnamed protein product, partial [Ilex paraguariensis]